MELNVQSYAEIYTTWIGWTQYSNLWGILTGTGLALLPFLGIIVSNTVGPFLQHSIDVGYRISLKKLEFELAVTLLVLMVVMSPFVKIETDTLHYAPVCGGEDATIEDNDTTYSDIYILPDEPKVPIAWMAVMGISQGFTHSAKTGLGCVPPARHVRSEMDASRIDDPALRAEVIDFNNSCWIPSWSKYQIEKPDISLFLATMDIDDLTWVGSRIFMGLGGYYDSFYAPYTVEGFPVSDANGGDELVSATAGIPTCTDWWEDVDAGLYNRLIDSLDTDFWDNVAALSLDEDAVKERIVRQLINNTETAVAITSNGFSNAGFWATSGAEANMLLEKPSFYPKSKMLLDSLPLIQSLLLMGVYTLLPVLMVVARYRLSAVISISLIMFSFVFWGYLWELAKYVDTFLIMALAPADAFSLEDIHFVVDAIALGSFLLLPLLLSSGFGWAGFAAGAAMSSMLSSGAQPMTQSASITGMLSSLIMRGGRGKK